MSVWNYIWFSKNVNKYYLPRACKLKKVFVFTEHQEYLTVFYMSFVNLLAAVFFFFLSGHSESFNFDIHRPLPCKYVLNCELKCATSSIYSLYLNIAAECMQFMGE